MFLYNLYIQRRIVRRGDMPGQDYFVGRSRDKEHGRNVGIERQRGTN